MFKDSLEGAHLPVAVDQELEEAIASREELHRLAQVRGWVAGCFLTGMCCLFIEWQAGLELAGHLFIKPFH